MKMKQSVGMKHGGIIVLLFHLDNVGLNSNELDGMSCLGYTTIFHLSIPLLLHPLVLPIDPLYFPWFFGVVLRRLAKPEENLIMSERSSFFSTHRVIFFYECNFHIIMLGDVYIRARGDIALFSPLQNYLVQDGPEFFFCCNVFITLWWTPVGLNAQFQLWELRWEWSFRIGNQDFPHFLISSFRNSGMIRQDGD